MREQIEQLIKNTLITLQNEKKLEAFDINEVVLEHPENSEHGDYSLNLAFVIAKRTGQDPVQVAEFIVDNARHLIQSSGYVENIEIAGSGFINLFLSKQHLVEELGKIVREKERYGRGSVQKKTMVIDYSGPNIAKPFGIGHLRSTIIGQAIYNMYAFLGWKVIGDNHLGDWGTPHGKILYQLKDKKLKGKTPKEQKEILRSLTIDDLEEMYVSFSTEAEKNPGIEEDARVWFRKLEQGDKEAKELWGYTKEISLQEFNRIYRLLHVQIDFALGESFYEPIAQEVLAEATKKGIAEESEGALIIPFPEDKLPPAILLKSDETTNYFTRDLATISYRLKKWNPDIIVYETGIEQTLHFQQLFWAAELFGWAKRDRFVHVAHGLYRTKEGKFSTRKGHTIHLEDVLREAVIKAKELVEKSENAKELSETEKEQIAGAVGIGGVKYNDLSQHPRRNIIFDWDKILNLKGNSAPYIQYTYARCQNILIREKKGVSVKKIAYSDFTREEMDVLRIMYQFPEVVYDAAEKFSPNLICNFVFDLAQKYNSFYNTHRVLQADTAEEKEFRLLLTAATAQVIQNSLSLLGIQTLDRI